MSLTDQQVSDNFDMLMNKYCTDNNALGCYGSSQTNSNALKQIVWYSEKTQVPAPTYDTLRAYNLTTLRQAKKLELIQQTFDNPDENDIKFAKFAKGVFSMLRRLMTNPVTVGITNGQAVTVLSNQFGIPEQQIINLLQNNNI